MEILFLEISSWGLWDRVQVIEGQDVVCDLTVEGFGTDVWDGVSLEVGGGTEACGSPYKGLFQSR